MSFLVVKQFLETGSLKASIIRALYKNEITFKMYDVIKRSYGRNH